MSEIDVSERMRADWNERAREDAHYYVAFGRRDQDDAEFFATGADVVRGLEAELKRLPRGRNPQTLRALEIGCGPGRLMFPMSRHFGEIHGVDVSDEMIRRAQSNLREIAHAHPRHSSGSDLSMFADGYFDFVYSYAVFQHIPSREVVFGYFHEVARVLKPGGIARLQINGLPETAKHYTTWDGARIAADAVAGFARDRGLQLLALEGIQTQYMWTTWRKPPVCRIRATSNAYSGEQAVPSRGRLACASVWVENLPGECDLNSLGCRIDGAAGALRYLGPVEDGLSQLNVLLPLGTRTGLLPVELFFHEKPLAAIAWIRVIEPGPVVPRVFSITDGVNLMSNARIERGSAKVTLEEIDSPDGFDASVDGQPVRDKEAFCIDPLNQRYEVNFLLPDNLPSGMHRLEMRLGSRQFAPVEIEVV